MNPAAFLSLFFTNNSFPSMQERFAKIPLSIVARIGELTKRETQVYVFLKACRNDRNGRCDPGRSTIARGVGLGLNHVWLAIRGLEQNGWIIEKPEGFEFVSADAIPKPAKLPKLGTSKVPKTGTFPIREHSQNGNNRFPNREAMVPKLGSDVIYTKQKSNRKDKQTMSPKPATARETDNPTKVFNYWKTVCEKNDRTTFTDKRRRAVVARLKKYSVKDIFDAIDGCKKSPHHSGENDTGTVYDDLELICRTDTHLERFIEHNERGRKRKREPWQDVGRHVPGEADPADIRPVEFCSTCDPASPGWIDIPETIDLTKYPRKSLGDKFPCPDCNADNYADCLERYKIAA